MKMLALSPHTDDVELGAGGFIAKALRLGCSCNVVLFCSSPRKEYGLESDQLLSEFFSSTSLLGIPSSNIDHFDFPIRSLPENRSHVLEILNKKKNEGYDVVLTPSTEDVHQDHITVTTEAKRIFKNATLLGYEMPWNNYKFSYTHFEQVLEIDLFKKLEALNCYTSQMNKSYFDPGFIRSLSYVRGVQSFGSGFAESFEVVRSTNLLC